MKKALTLVVLIVFCYVPVICQKAKKATAVLPHTIATGAPVPAGLVVIAMTAESKTIKTPAARETICDGSPVPPGYTVISQTGTDSCAAAGVNPLTNALLIAREDAAADALKQVAEQSAHVPRPTYARLNSPTTGRTSDEDEGVDSDAAHDAVQALRRMSSATRIGVNFSEYKGEVLTLKERLDTVMSRVPNGTFRDEVFAAYREYMYAVDIWSLMIRNGFDWILAEGGGPGNQLMMRYHIEPIRASNGERRLTRQLVMSAIWEKAGEHSAAAISSLK